jgi:prepilin-type N-terminal cleavage/methylation domain-containing protein
MLHNSMRKHHDGEAGFTLVELLVVIVILGVLAGIVVFAVGGITNNSTKSACAADVATIQTAEDTYFAQNNAYVSINGTAPSLVSVGLLRSNPTLSSTAGVPYVFTASTSTGAVTVAPVCP